MSEVWRVGGRYEKRYSVLWPWIPLLGLLRANMPPLGARGEARNAERLRALGIEAPRVLGVASRLALVPWGVRHESTVALEPLEGRPLDLVLGGARAGAADATTAAPARREIARALGRLVARMHEASIFHRDLYLCHLLWDGKRIAVLDVARARPRRALRGRFRVKDVAALAYSSAGLVRPREAVAFLRAYSGAGRRIDRRFLRRVRAKASWMARHGKKM